MAITINGGLIGSTKEAKFKTEVRQIQEYLEAEKVSIIIKQESNVPVAIPSTLDELRIDEKLKQKYGEKLTIDQSEIKLLYNVDKVTEQEANWLQELGIEQNQGSLTFKQEIEGIAFDTEKIGEFVNLDSLKEQIKEKYPETCILYSLILGNVEAIEIFDIDVNGTYKTVAMNYVGLKEIEKIIQEEGLANDIIIEETSDNQYVQEILSIANEYEIINSVKNKTVEQINSLSNSLTYINNVNLYVSLNENNLIIDAKGNVNNNDLGLILMSEEEANALFTFEEHSETNGIAKVALTNYIGNESEVKIPDFVYDSNGDVIKWVDEIKRNSFDLPTLISLPSVWEISNEEYSQMTVSELYDYLVGETYTGENGDSTDNNIKKALLIEILQDEGMAEEDLVIDDQGIPYIYTTIEEGAVPKPEQELKKITIGNAMRTVEESAFNGSSITEIICLIGSIGEINTNAFSGCTNLSIIRLPRQNLDEEQPEGFDTYWGAPNENIKIYDAIGEYPR